MSRATHPDGDPDSDPDPATDGGTDAGSRGTPAAPPPSAEQLLALGSDAWALVLGAARQAFADGDHEAATEALRTAPISRLVAGPLRTELARALATDPSLWQQTLAALQVSETHPDELTGLLAEPSAPDAEGTSPTDPSRMAEELDRARRRARSALQERDRWRRRAEGAEARLGLLEEARAEADRAVASAESEIVRLREQVRRAADDQRRAVEREGRRRESQIERLEETVRALRRAEEDRRAEEKRRREVARAQRDEAERARRDAERLARTDAELRAVPGRPSQLPEGVAPGTTMAAAALVHRGRLVLIDGYNVTKQHRAHLDLDAQRSWLVQLVGALAGQRGIRAVVVFDGQLGGGRVAPGHRDVQVRFTVAGITADDEIVLAVEATDEPVVVVTDDRELIERVQASGADVIATRSLLGLM